MIPFIGVSGLYLALAAVAHWDAVPLGVLLNLEVALGRAHAFLSFFKIGATASLFVLAAIWLLGLLRLPWTRSSRFFAIFDRYQRMVRRVYIVTVLLGSFTFFGTQLGEPTQDVQLRIKTIRDGYADLVSAAREAVRNDIARQTFPAVRDAFPKDYRDALALPARINTDLGNLRSYYEAVREDAGGRRSEVEALLARSTERAKIRQLRRSLSMTWKTLGSPPVMRTIRAPSARATSTRPRRP